MMFTTSLTEKMKIVSNGIGNLYSIKKKIGDGWDCFPQKMIDPPLHPSYNKTVRFFFLLTQYIFFSNEPLFFADLKIIVIEAAEILLIKWKHFSEKVIHSYSLRLDARCFILQKLQCPLPEVFWCTFNLSWTWTLLWDNRCFQNAIPSFCTNFTKINWR